MAKWKVGDPPPHKCQVCGKRCGSWLPVKVADFVADYEGEALQSVCESCHARLTGRDFYGHMPASEAKPCINGHVVDLDSEKNAGRYGIWIHCPECEREGKELIVPLLADRHRRNRRSREAAGLAAIERKRLQREAGADEETPASPSANYVKPPEPPKPERPAQMSLL